MSHFARVVLSVFAAGISLPVLGAQPASLDAPAIVKELAKRCKEAKRYVWEGDIALDVKRGTGPVERVGQGAVKLASGEGGRYYIDVRAEGLDPYVLASDGGKSWAFVPGKKRYSEEEAAPVAEDESDAGSDDERPIVEKFARLLVPILGDMSLKLEGADNPSLEEVKVAGKKVKLPVVRALSAKDADGGRTLTVLVLDPNTLIPARVVWNTATYSGDQKKVIRLAVDLRVFRLGDIPDSAYVFEPPKNAKLVDEVAIPGQTGSFLLNKPAPDFELKTLDGEVVRLKSLQGKPVLLSFWASWCGPCRRELPGLNELYGEFGGKGLVVLGINDEDKGDARRYVAKAGLKFPILHDGSKRVARAYRVRSIPTVFLLDRDGMIVRFFSGSRDVATLRTALVSAGLKTQ